MNKPVTRLDANTMDPDVCRKYDVTLNGVRQRLCIVADSVEGYVIKYTRGLFGVPTKGRGGSLKTQRVYGKVTITLRPPKQLMAFDESTKLKTKDWDTLNARIQSSTKSN